MWSHALTRGRISQPGPQGCLQPPKRRSASDALIEFGVDHNSGHPSNQPRHLTRNRLIAQALHRLILQLRLVLAGFMIKALNSCTGASITMRGVT